MWRNHFKNTFSDTYLQRTHAHSATMRPNSSRRIFLSEIQTVLPEPGLAFWFKTVAWHKALAQISVITLRIFQNGLNTFFFYGCLFIKKKIKINMSDGERKRVYLLLRNICRLRLAVYGWTELEYILVATKYKLNSYVLSNNLSGSTFSQTVHRRICQWEAGVNT